MDFLLCSRTDGGGADHGSQHQLSLRSGAVWRWDLFLSQAVDRHGRGPGWLDSRIAYAGGAAAPSRLSPAGSDSYRFDSGFDSWDRCHARRCPMLADAPWFNISAGG